MEILASLDVQTIAAWATGIVTAASAIAALTPSKADDAALMFLRRLIDALALNIGNARPKGRDE